MGKFSRLLSGVGKTVEKILRKSAQLGAKWLGFDLLTKEQTQTYLTNYLVATHPGNSFTLPQVVNLAHPTTPIFQKTEITAQPTHVWRYERGQKSAMLLPCGVLLTNHKVLNTDYWSHDILKKPYRPKRTQRHAQTVIAPFSHYFDGNVFVGYYDFMLLVAAKICRIKAALPNEEFARAVVAYPLVNTTYEREFLTLMGFKPDQIVDTRQANVQFERCLLGDHTNWTHQNAADIMALKYQVETRLQIQRTARNRVYISRACRRSILNEEALIEMLKRYGFQIIEDKPRTIAEQCAIYKNASFIVGPHGASFTNFIWCEPGTQIVELFSAKYAPNYFLYLAQLMNLHYTAYSQEIVSDFDMGAIGDDIPISIPDLERCIIGLLESSVSAHLSDV